MLNSAVSNTNEIANCRIRQHANGHIRQCTRTPRLVAIENPTHMRGKCAGRAKARLCPSALSRFAMLSDGGSDEAFEGCRRTMDAVGCVVFWFCGLRCGKFVFVLLDYRVVWVFDCWRIWICSLEISEFRFGFFFIWSIICVKSRSKIDLDISQLSDVSQHNFRYDLSFCWNSLGGGGGNLLVAPMAHNKGYDERLYTSNSKYANLHL